MIKKSFVLLITILCLVWGCKSGSNPSGPALPNNFIQTGPASLNIAIVIPDNQELKASAILSTLASVNFKLTLLNPQDGTVFPINKTVGVENGSATVYFSNLPSLPAYVNISIASGSIAGFKKFSGSVDLIAGNNTMIVSPEGTNATTTIAAYVMEQLSKDPIRLKVAPVKLVDSINQMLLGLDISSSLINVTATNKFIGSINIDSVDKTFRNLVNLSSMPLRATWLCSDPNGNIYNSTGGGIWRIYPGEPVQLVSNQGVRIDYVPADGSDPLDMQLSFYGICWFNGYLTFSAHSSSRSMIYQLRNGKVYRLAGEGPIGYSGDGGPALSARIYYPKGITTDGQRLFFSDYGNDKIRMIDKYGVISTLPLNIPINCEKIYWYDNKLFILDYLSSSIKIFENGLVKDFAFISQTIKPDAIPARSANLTPVNNIYITSIAGIVAYKTGHIVIYGRNAPDAGVIYIENGLATAWPYPLADPNAVLNVNGNLVVGDEFDQVYQIGTLAESPSPKPIPQPGPLPGVSPFKLLIDTNSLNQRPKWLCADPSGNVYMSGGQAIWRIYPGTPEKLVWNNNSITDYIPEDGSNPLDVRLTIGSICWFNGYLTFVARSSLKSMIYQLRSGGVFRIAGSVIGFGGDGGPAIDSRIYSPEGLTSDGDNLYIADSGNGRIRKIDSNGRITTYAGNGSYGSSGENISALEASISTEHILWHDNKLLISDYGFQSVRAIENGIIKTFAFVKKDQVPDAIAAIYADKTPVNKVWLNSPKGITSYKNGYVVCYGRNFPHAGAVYIENGLATALVAPFSYVHAALEVNGNLFVCDEFMKVWAIIK